LALDDFFEELFRLTLPTESTGEPSQFRRIGAYPVVLDLPDSRRMHIG
jgi:hypothetical protein